MSWVVRAANLTHRLVATGVDGVGWPGKDGDGARPFTDIADRRIRSEGS